MQADLLVGSWRQTRCRPQRGQDTGGIRRRQQVNLLGGTPQVDEVHPATIVWSRRSGQMGSYYGNRHENVGQIALRRFASWWITEGDADFAALGRGPWGCCPVTPPTSTAFKG